MTAPLLAIDEVYGQIMRYKSYEKAPKSHVYFISDGEFVKIGVAKNINNRLRELQVANARKLSILREYPCENDVCAFALEKAFHKYFYKKRLEGEWFDILNLLNDFDKKEDVMMENYKQYVWR